MSISDELMWRYLELLSFEPPEKIASRKQAVQEGGNPRDVKVDFAREIVGRFHGTSAAAAAAASFSARFSRNETPEDMPEVRISAKDALAIPQVLKQAGLAASASEALRLIEQGGVKIDGVKVGDKTLKLARGVTAVVQVGKRKFARVIVE
jgi:tyrosyl-tRNA synthetase